MASTLSPTRASMLGTLGMRRRWARTVDPAQRRAATRPARDALAQKYLATAAAMPGGDSLSPDQLAERARQIRRRRVPAAAGLVTLVRYVTGRPVGLGGTVATRSRGRP
jgi:hypothetical protein